jgi:hypothetical protein
MVAWHEVPGKATPKRIRPEGTVWLAIATRETDLSHKPQFAF